MILRRGIYRVDSSPITSPPSHRRRPQHGSRVIRLKGKTDSAHRAFLQSVKFGLLAHAWAESTVSATCAGELHGLKCTSSLWCKILFFQPVMWTFFFWCEIYYLTGNYFINLTEWVESSVGLARIRFGLNHSLHWDEFVFFGQII